MRTAAGAPVFVRLGTNYHDVLPDATLSDQFLFGMSLLVLVQELKENNAVGDT